VKRTGTDISQMPDITARFFKNINKE